MGRLLDLLPGHDGMSGGGDDDDDVSRSLTTADYTVVVLYVVASVGVGWVFSAGSSTSDSSYFLAGKGANKWVTGISLISGLTSGISFLGVPGFSYTHGVAMLSFIFGYALAAPFVLFIAIPFFARPELRFTTAYSYLEVRFNRPVRLVAATSFLIRGLIYMGFVLYAPALALEAVARVKVVYTVLVCGSLATVYTCKGGMKAVIWTDFMASLALIAGVCTALGISIGSTKGNAWEIAEANNATIPDGFYDFDPISQINFWNMGLGFAFNTAAQTGTDQIAVQRYLATANVKAARTTAYLSIFGNIAMLAFLTFLGMGLNVFYSDPERHLPGKILRATDEIFPYFFTNALPNGVAGLIVAALFATTMSVFSGGINGIVTCFIVDVLQSGNGDVARWSTGVSTVRLAKALTIVCGVFSIVVAYLAQFVNVGLSEIVSVAQAVCCAPTFGMFLLGMLSERANSQDALVGFVVSVLFLIYCLVGSAMCPDGASSDSTAHHDAIHLRSECFGVYEVARVSKWAYAMVGTVVCVVAGCFSMVTRGGTSPPAHKVMGFTWNTRHMPILAEARGRFPKEQSEKLGGQEEDAATTPLLLN